VLAGHLHPAATLKGAARDRMRLPCFSVDQAPGQAQDGMAILPAFGAFTGTFGVQPAPGRQVYVVVGGAVWPLPLNGAAAGG
jgi:metallophosphoesterase superfamily enzyme